MKNDLVSFLIHPVGIKQIKENFGSVYNNLKFLQPVVNRISDRFVKSAYTLFPPHRFLKVNNIISESKSKIDLEIIMLPLFPSQLVGLNKDFIEEKICDSIEYASKIGSKLIALGGFTSIAGNQVKGLLTNKKKCNIAVTTGNTLTAALCIEGIIKACELLEKKIDKSSLLVIGATGDIGSAVSKVLASKFQRIFLMSREINEQSYIFQQALSMNKNTVCVNRISPDLLNNSDVVFVATSAVQAILDPVFLKKGSIVADVSIPANVKSFDRKDVFIFEAGKAKFSFFQDFISEKSSFLFGKNSIYGCLAEALVLGFEKKFESYSVGRGEITDRKIFEISALAKKHGVTLSDLSYGDFYYSRDFNEGIVEC